MSDQAGPPTWEDLSDSELRARIMQRREDLARSDVDRIVRWRDSWETAKVIDGILGADSADLEAE